MPSEIVVRIAEHRSARGAPVRPNLASTAEHCTFPGSEGQLHRGWFAQAQVADDFVYLARTPANAARKALQKIGLQPEQVDLWEINEAFASVA